MISSFQKLESNKESGANYRQKMQRDGKMERGEERGGGSVALQYHLGGPSQDVHRRPANRQM